MIYESDRDEVLETRGIWQYRKHCNRGATPYFSLHRKKTFLVFSIWTFAGWSMELRKLQDYAKRWDEWPSVKPANQIDAEHY